jgi:thiamine transport system permease protein
MRGTLPGLGAIIFLLAFTSFPVVLLLGGALANQTLEVAIYSAVRLDFNLDAAVTLALVQIAVCAVIIVGASAFGPIPASIGIRRWRRMSRRRRASLRTSWRPIGQSSTQMTRR